MPASLVPCPTCARPVFADAESCPFCAARSRRTSRLGMALMGAVAPVVLAACYGPPMGDKYDDTGTAMDLDGDGFYTPEDCDDADSAVNPEAIEVCDDTIDNDCDGKIDADDEDCAAK